MIEEANWAALSRYETKFQIIGMKDGTCGGFPLFYGIDVVLQVQLIGKNLDSSILENIKTRAI